jgi:hypothetical protein
MIQGASDIEWITAIAAAVAAAGTVLAFAVALFQIYQEREARKEQERDLLQRERRAQAERISAWPGVDLDEHTTSIALSNRSEEPVYRAVASLVLIQGAGASTGKELVDRGHHEWQATLSVIPPGDYQTVVAGGWRGMGARPGVELAFTDRAGAHWLRAADGTLSELDTAPVEYYGLAQPVGWTVPVDR